MNTVKAIKLVAKLAYTKQLGGVVHLSNGHVHGGSAGVRARIAVDWSGRDFALDARAAGRIGTKAVLAVNSAGKLIIVDNGIETEAVLAEDGHTEPRGLLAGGGAETVMAVGLFRRALEYAARDDRPRRYALGTVSVNCGVAATDGKRAFISSAYTGEGAGLLSVVAAEFLAKAAGCKDVRIVFSGGVFTIRSGDVEIVTECVAGEFPDIKGILPTVPSIVRIDSRPADVAKWKALGRSLAKGVEAADASRVWPGVAGWFDVRFMVQALETMPYAVVSGISPEHPLLFETGDATAVLMPVIPYG